jgi:hypothetical protein
MSDRVDTIRRYVEAPPGVRSRKQRPEILAALDALLAENLRLRDALQQILDVPFNIERYADAYNIARAALAREVSA